MKKVYGRQNISKDKLLFVLIIFILIIGFGGYSYARYLTSLSGNATTSVAAWNAVIKKNSQPTTTNLDLVLTPTTNTDVVEGKIAPGLSATGTYEIDFAGSEVSADYLVTIGTATNLPTGATLTITATETINGTAGTPQTVTVGEEYEGNFTLSEVTTGTGAKVLLTVTANWPNNEANNTTDTTLGTSHNNITIPITLTAQQHIENAKYAVVVDKITRFYVGQTFPQGVNGRDTAAEAIEDWSSITGGIKYPFYIKNILNKNNEIEECYIEFVVTEEIAQENPGMTAGTYALQGCDSGASFNKNKNLLIEVFDYENHPNRCDSNQTTSFTCSSSGGGLANDYNIYISSQGSIISLRSSLNYACEGHSNYLYCTHYNKDPV